MEALSSHHQYPQVNWTQVHVVSQESEATLP
jgi:hypothetical protein